MINEEILEKLDGDVEMEAIISTFWSAYTSAEPYVDKLEEALREEFKKSNWTSFLRNLLVMWLFLITFA